MISYILFGFGGVMIWTGITNPVDPMIRNTPNTALETIGFSEEYDSNEVLWQSSFGYNGWGWIVR